MMHFDTFGLDGRIENSAPGPSQKQIGPQTVAEGRDVKKQGD